MTYKLHSDYNLFINKYDMSTRLTQLFLTLSSQLNVSLRDCF